MTRTTNPMVEAYVFRRTKSDIHFLLLKRAASSHYGGLWQGVAGHIQAGEKAWEAALRELEEETGLTPRRLFIVDAVSRFYNAHLDEVTLVPIFGIEVETEQVRLSPEHVEFRWVPYSVAQRLLLWKGQQQGLETLNKMLTQEDSRISWSEIPISDQRGN